MKRFPGTTMKKLAYPLDVLCIVIFVAIGRHAHSHGITWKGMVSTSWPFLSGLLLGWITVAIMRHTITAPRSGFEVVISTVVVGMILRVIAGQGTAITFCIVALTFLTLFLVGWRFILLKKFELRFRIT